MGAGDSDGDTEDPRKALSALVRGNSVLPLWQSAGLGVTYCGFCILGFFLIHHAEHNGTGLDKTSTVLYIEIAKLVSSVLIFGYRTGKFLPLKIIQEGSWRAGIWYAVPAGLYAIYNSLTFVNLGRMDPSTYQVCMQMRVIFTGLVFQVVFQKQLGKQKWLALVLLALGVALKNITGMNWASLATLSMTFVAAQAALSALAGVYNEYLMKKDLKTDVNEQNFFMYSWGIFFLFSFGLFTNPGYYFSAKWIQSIDGILLVIIFAGAAQGLAASMILKFINVIVKAFVSATEVLLTAILAHFILGTVLGIQDILAIVTVTLAVWLYYTA